MHRRLRRLLQNRMLRELSGCILTGVAGILLLACCMVYTTGSFRSTFRKFCQNVVGSYAINLTRTTSNIYGYLNYSEHSIDGNVLVQILGQSYPYQLYLAHLDDISLDQYVQEARNQINSATDLEEEELAEVVNQFLYYNGEIHNAQNQTGDGMEVAAAETSGDSVSNGESGEDSTDVNIISGEVYFEDETTEGESIDVASINTTSNKLFSLNDLLDYNVLIKNCYIVDSTTKAEESLFDASKLLTKDLTITITKDEPQILIYHTHSQEAFIDSREGVEEDTVVGVGEELARILREDYGIGVMHDTTTYDLIDGVLDRNLAYSKALPSIENILECNPSIQVVIDLHRDSGQKRVTTINGEECAKIMFFNGLSRNSNGEITALPNQYIEDNLAFSLQLYLNGKSTFSDLMVHNYLKSYRYNLHLCPRSLLVELGTQMNTVEEAKNTMKYFAKLLYDELTTKQSYE